MAKDVLHIENVNEARDDRFHRFKLIGWWDQECIRDAKILVVGAGALGNEIVKNLALLGIGRVFVVDLDTVEHSNLSRSVMFRAGDEGRPKAEVIAEAARNIYPDIRIQPLQSNAVYDLGLGVFRWADIVLGGLDNREARLAINCGNAREGRLHRVRSTRPLRFSVRSLSLRGLRILWQFAWQNTKVSATSILPTMSGGP